MIYVQARYYFASAVACHFMWAIPKKHKLHVALWALLVCVKTINWNLKTK